MERAQLKQIAPFGNCPKLNSHARWRLVCSGGEDFLADLDCWWSADGIRV